MSQNHCLFDSCGNTMNIPVGFRFQPTDQELIIDYLSKKLKGETLPCNIITECEIYGDKEPWKIFGVTSSETFYVFTKLKKKDPAGRRIDRTAGCGTWHAQRSDPVKDSENNHLGLRKLFVFKVKDSNIAGKGHWIMHEYSLLNDHQSEYVVCSIRNKDAIVDEDDDEPPRKKTRKISDMVEEDGAASTSVPVSEFEEDRAVLSMMPAAAALSHQISEFQQVFTADYINPDASTVPAEATLTLSRPIPDFQQVSTADYINPDALTVPAEATTTFSHPIPDFQQAYSAEYIDEMLDFMNSNQCISIDDLFRG